MFVNKLMYQKNTEMSVPPEGCDSVHGVARSDSEHHMSDFKVDCLINQPSPKKTNSCTYLLCCDQDDEFVIYNVKQQKLRCTRYW